jgi:deoxyhypusine synthase
LYETFSKWVGCIPFLSFIFAKIKKMSKPITEFIEKYYLHFNAAALVDASKGYVAHLKDGGKMMITLAGAMSTAELGKILAEMIRQEK